MTADTTNTESNARSSDQGNGSKSGARKAARKRSGARSSAAKRSRGASSRTNEASSRSKSPVRKAARRTGSGASSASGSTSRSSRSGIASRVLSSGRRAADWAVEGASRAIPLATRGLSDLRMVQRLADERPYMLGAIGLGIGALIGLMLPGTLSSMRGGSAARGRARGTGNR